jgi:hypothetical protein
MSNTSKSDQISREIKESGLSMKDWYRQIYLKSDHWRQIRVKALAASNFSCSGCGYKDMLQVHHLTYSNLGDESVEDLMALCSRCHGLAHDLLKEMKEKVDPAIQRRVMSHFLYYATIPKSSRKKGVKAKKNHKFNTLPSSVRKMVSKAKKSLQQKPTTHP